MRNTHNTHTRSVATMVYITGGSVQQKRTVWRLSIITDYLKGIWDAIHTL